MSRAWASCASWLRLLPLRASSRSTALWSTLRAAFGTAPRAASRTKRATVRPQAFARSVTVAISVGVQRTSLGMVRSSDVEGVIGLSLVVVLLDGARVQGV